MNPDKEITLAKLDAELRAAGVEFTTLIQTPDGTLSLRDAQDEEITDERLAAVVEAHVADPPHLGLSERLKARWQELKPASGTPQVTAIRALTDAFEAFLEEHAKEANPTAFIPVTPPELVPISEAEAALEAAQVREEEVAQEAAQRQEVIDLLALARQIAHEKGVSDAAFVSAIVKTAVQEQALLNEAK